MNYALVKVILAAIEVKACHSSNSLPALLESIIRKVKGVVGSLLAL